MLFPYPVFLSLAVVASFGAAALAQEAPPVTVAPSTLEAAPVAPVAPEVPVVQSAPVAQGSMSIAQWLTEDTTLVKIGGRQLDAVPLRAFYLQRGYTAAWSNPTAIINDVQALAYAEGMTPELYGIPTTSSEAERDILVSDSLARFARDVAIGRVSPTRSVGGMGPGLRGTVDPVAFLVDVSANKAAPALVEALAPPYAGYTRLKAALPKYRALVAAGGWRAIADGPSIKPGISDARIPLVRARLIATGELDASAAHGNVLDSALSVALKKFQTNNGMEPDGAVGKQTLTALNISAEDRLRQLESNLERWRWMPRTLPNTHIVVNLPAARLEFIKDGEIKLSMRTVVGDRGHPTPTMMTTMMAVIVNPTWTVPASIASKEILPKLRTNPDYLAKSNMQILSSSENGVHATGQGVDWSRHTSFPYQIRQAPGPGNALGYIKFALNNNDGIYLHDTPSRSYFKRAERALSHGCIRLERPLSLAQEVIAGDSSAGRINGMISAGGTKTLGVKAQVNVYLTYMTAWADDDGTVHFRSDVYGHDGRLRTALKRGETMADTSDSVTKRGS